MGVCLCGSGDGRLRGTSGTGAVAGDLALCGDEVSFGCGVAAICAAGAFTRQRYVQCLGDGPDDAILFIFHFCILDVSPGIAGDFRPLGRVGDDVTDP